MCNGVVWKVTIRTCDSTLIPEFTFIQKSLGIRHHACNFIIIGFCTSPRKAWCLLCPRSTPNIHWPTGVCPSTYHNYEGKKIIKNWTKKEVCNFLYHFIVYCNESKGAFTKYVDKILACFLPSTYPLLSFVKEFFYINRVEIVNSRLGGIL